MFSSNTSMINRIEGIHKLVIPTPYPVGAVNIYLVVEEDTVTLIDIGPKTDEAWFAFISQLKQIGFSLSDIDQVILTHHHPDHCGLLDILLKNRVIPVKAHPSAKPWVEQNPDFLQWHQNYFSELYQKIGVNKELWKHIDKTYDLWDQFSCRVQLNDFLQEGTTIPGMQGWKVYETPGHAQSHLVFFRERDGVLIAGDHIIKHISPNPILEPPLSPGLERPRTLIQYRESLVRCKRLEVTTAFSGHGDEVYDMENFIEIRLQEHENRAEKIRDWLKDESLTPFEISQRMFPQKYEKALLLTMSEVLGHLDLLLQRQQVVYEESFGITKFRADI